MSGAGQQPPPPLPTPRVFQTLVLDPCYPQYISPVHTNRVRPILSSTCWPLFLWPHPPDPCCTRQNQPLALDCALLTGYTNPYGQGNTTGTRLFWLLQYLCLRYGWRLHGTWQTSTPLELFLAIWNDFMVHILGKTTGWPQYQWAWAWR